MNSKLKLFYVSLVSFPLIASSALAINKTLQYRTITVTTVLAAQDTHLPPIPRLKSNSNFPELTAHAVVAMDVDSGVTLFQKNPDQKVLPASTTKIITGLVAMDYFSPDQVLENHGVSVEGQKMKLVPGEKITFQDILYGLLVYSANDAAEVIAQNFPGGRTEFINAMNTKAKLLGLKNSNFANPTGLEEWGHYSTAKDLVLAATFAVRKPEFLSVVGTKDVVVKSVDKKYTHNLKNINELVGSVEGVLGIKTGWTENAQENLVSYIDRGGKKVIIALLGSKDRFGESKALIEWIYSNYDWVAPKI